MRPQARQSGFVHPQVGVGTQSGTPQTPHPVTPPSPSPHQHTRLGSCVSTRVCVFSCGERAGLRLSGFNLGANT